MAKGSNMKSEIDSSDGRRTDTRDKIFTVALDVFAERGYEKATLREIADRLGVTRPALYYHFASKEAILEAVHDQVAASFDTLIKDGKNLPRTAESRREILRQLLMLMSGAWGRFARFAESNEAAMRDLTGARSFIQQTERLTELLQPTRTVAGRMAARLAIGAILMIDARSEQLGGTTAQRRAAALQVAGNLVA